MIDTETILLTHLERYPDMQPQDCIKLLYQNEFGCEHLVADRDAALAWIKKEYDSVPHDPEHILIENIGGGWTRVHMEPLEAKGISPEALCKVFIESERVCKDNNAVATKHRFLKKIDLLERLSLDGKTCFTHEQLVSFLEQYRALDYPPVHHSEIFRKKYHPTYRVIWGDYLKEFGLMD